MDEDGSYRFSPTNLKDEISGEALLQSEIAALKYKNERLTLDLREYETRVKTKEYSISQQNGEIDSLKENLARLNAINLSLQKKLQEIEERERNLYGTNQRNENELQRSKVQNQHYQDRIVELESQIRSILIDREASDQAKDHSQRVLNEFSRKIASAIDFHDDSSKSELILKKIYEIYQENSRLKMKTATLSQSIESFQNENKANMELISRINVEKDNLNQQIISYLSTIDLLKREKDQMFAEKSYINTELQTLKEKSTIATKTVCNLNEQNKILDGQILNYKENLHVAEDKGGRAEKELKNFQESISIQLSSGQRMVDATPIGIRERIKDIQIELKEKQFANDQLREKVGRMSETIERLEKLLGDSKMKQENAIGDKFTLTKRLEESEGHSSTLEIVNEGLRKDKKRFMQFLEQLGSIMGLDEVSKELGFDLQTDAILARSEQLSKLEGDKLADKTATVYQLQRRLRTLREQLEKKDLHLDMLRKKILTLEESVKIRSSLELEKEEAVARSKRLFKQLERIELDLKDGKISNKDLRSQLADAAQYKIIALERARNIEQLEKKMNDLELLRIKYNRKVSYLKDQVKISRENTHQERDLHDHAFQQLSNELNGTKKSLLESNRREAQLLHLRNMVGRILGIDWNKTVVPDYELIGKLEKIVQTNREFAQVSRKLSDSIQHSAKLHSGEPRDNDNDKEDSIDEFMYDRKNI